MRHGKISENVLRRSVLKYIKAHRDEVVSGAAVGEDCAILAPFTQGDRVETDW